MYFSEKVRIASLRQKQNLTLKEVAEKANITSSMLSQLENGKANPSVETLRKIASALDVPMFVFFAENDRVPHRVIRKSEHKKITFSPERQVEYTMLSPSSNTEIEMAIMDIYPSQNSVTKPMSHIGEEVAHVLAGKVELLLGADTFLLEEGDSVHIPSGINHKWTNVGETMVRVIFAITPPTF